MSERKYLDEAKRLLKNALANNADADVRTLNAIAELSDDHPAVLRIAEKLAAGECRHEWRHYADFDRCFKCGAMS